jgi:hypothetical protein
MHFSLICDRDVPKYMARNLKHGNTNLNNLRIGHSQLTASRDLYIDISSEQSSGSNGAEDVEEPIHHFDLWRVRERQTLGGRIWDNSLGKEQSTKRAYLVERTTDVGVTKLQESAPNNKVNVAYGLSALVNPEIEVTIISCSQHGDPNDSRTDQLLHLSIDSRHFAGSRYQDISHDLGVFSSYHP